MALFGLADISFNGNNSPRNGPMGKLVNSEFERTTLRYPSDLGNYDKSHYMVFYIRKQKASSVQGMTDAKGGITSSGSGSLPTSIPAIPSPAKLGSELTSKVNSAVSSLNSMTNNALSSVTNSINSAIGSAVGTVSNLFGSATSKLTGNSEATKSILNNSIKSITGGSFATNGLGVGDFNVKTTKLTTDAIALYMPDTLQYTYSQSYDSAALGEEFAGKVAAAGSSAKDAYDSGGAGAAGASVLKSAAQTVAQKATETVLGGNSGKVGSLALLGKVQNPMLEMIYKSPEFRRFTFEFRFYPRDEKEGYEVQRIIERFRFHQAPELDVGSMGFLVPPSEFEIGLYYGGATNPNLPPIATCILTGIDVNYAPDGFSAYEVPGVDKPFLGGTGMPVSIQMTLNFQEITYLTKSDFNQDIAVGAR